MFSYLSPEERVPAKHPLRPIRLMVDEVLKALVASVQWALLGLRPAIDSAGEVVAGLAFAGTLHSSQRTDVDGATGVQPAVPVVCWPEHG